VNRRQLFSAPLAAVPALANPAYVRLHLDDGSAPNSDHIWFRDAVMSAAEKLRLERLAKRLGACGPCRSVSVRLFDAWSRL
jgi:hypothetical protein